MVHGSPENRCSSGGAKIGCFCTNAEVEARAVDLDDGSYSLEWRSKLSGTFEVTLIIHPPPSTLHPPLSTLHSPPSPSPFA